MDRSSSADAGGVEVGSLYPVRPRVRSAGTRARSDRSESDFDLRNRAGFDSAQGRERDSATSDTATLGFDKPQRRASFGATLCLRDEFAAAYFLFVDSPFLNPIREVPGLIVTRGSM